MRVQGEKGPSYSTTLIAKSPPPSQEEILTTTPRLILVDTDVSLGTPGAEIDDGAALIALLRCKAVNVLGLCTVFGNVAVDLATHNARRLLSCLGREEIPIAAGAPLPLLEDPSWFADFQLRYGRTPAWPGESPLPIAANFLIETVRANQGRVTLLALGPLTNLALAARLAPDIVDLVQAVFAMGGSFDSANPTAEFNVRNDPEAAQIVFSAGWPVYLLGLDVTRQVLFSREEFQELPGDDPALDLLKRQAPAWIDLVEEQGWETGGCALHDAVAVAALLDQTLFQTVEATVEVELADRARRGQVHMEPIDRQRGSLAGTARVATAVDVDPCRSLIWSLLVSR